MDPLVVISPHLDDAVLSLGQMMAGRPDVVVVTVFTGTPADADMLTSFDRNSGFTTAAQAMAIRRREDDAALAALHATPIRLPFIDCQYCPPAVEAEAEVADAVTAVCRAVAGATVMVGPVGLAHPDHHRTRRAFEAAARRLLGDGRYEEAWLYEELPARVLWPEQVPDAIAWWEGMGWRADIDFLGTGPKQRKSSAIAAYQSQAWALDRGCLFVPERVWRLSR